MKFNENDLNSEKPLENDLNSENGFSESDIPEYQDSSKKSVKDSSKYNDKLWQSSYGEKDFTEDMPIKFKLANDYSPILSLNEEGIQLDIIELQVVNFLESNPFAIDFKKTKKVPKKNEILFFYKITKNHFKDISCIEIFYFISNYFGINDKRFYKYLDESDKKQLLKALKNRGYL